MVGYAALVAEVDKALPLYKPESLRMRLILGVYDAAAYGFNCPVAWRCPKSQLVELYDAHVSARHLDIGVATGRLLHECRYPVTAPQITLMDVSQNALDMAARRLARYAPRTHCASVLEPWGLQSGAYESVGMSNLLHCLPGAMPAKAVAFEHARTALAPGGVLFGATVLGKGVKHTWLSRSTMARYNRRGIFSNLDDSLEDLDAALGRVFDSHETQVKGAIALFSARVAS
jgi:SAM-dependent methyltransferase